MAWAAEFLEDGDTAEKRYASRRTLRMALEASLSSDTALAAESASAKPNALIHNLSTTGLLLETNVPLNEGETFDITLPEIGTTEVNVVWRSGLLYGCEFTTPVTTGVVSAVMLRAPAKPLPTAEELLETQTLTEEDQQGWLAERPESEDAWSFRTKGLVILGSTLSLWAMIGAAAWAAFR